MQTNGQMIKAFLAILGIIFVGLVVLDVEDLMLLVFPLWIFTYIFKKQLGNLVEKIPKDFGFIVAVVLYGVAIEVFVILNNLGLPENKRVLLDADPFRDLIFGVFYYIFVIIVWYLLLQKIRFSRRKYL